MEHFTAAAFPTPWGWAAALSSASGLRRLSWPEADERSAWEALGAPPNATPDPAFGAALGERLERYFAGEGPSWDQQLDPQGTPFQQAVWDATSAIPPGQRRTYGEIARAIGRPRSARAVGQALRANPIPLLIPCHRVVGSDGSLCGYGGPDGVALKARLLELERAVAAKDQRR